MNRAFHRSEVPTAEPAIDTNRGLFLSLANIPRVNGHFGTDQNLSEEMEHSRTSNRPL